MTKRKKTFVSVTYKFVVEYEREEQLTRIKADLKDQPIYDLGGAEVIDGEVYGYSCKRVKP